jgi:hypothetical protein
VPDAPTFGITYGGKSIIIAPEVAFARANTCRTKASKTRSLSCRASRWAPRRRPTLVPNGASGNGTRRLGYGLA